MQVVIDADRKFAYLSRTHQPDALIDLLKTLAKQAADKYPAPEPLPPEQNNSGDPQSNDTDPTPDTDESEIETEDDDGSSGCTASWHDRPVPNHAVFWGLVFLMALSFRNRRHV